MVEAVNGTVLDEVVLTKPPGWVIASPQARAAQAAGIAPTPTDPGFRMHGWYDM